MDAAYYRARISAIGELLRGLPDGDEKNNDRVLLRNGMVPEKLIPAFDKALAHHQDLLQARNHQPLSFAETCSFNTWFAMHPEKVAGIEYVTTSRDFPVMVRGTKDDIVETVSGGLSDNKGQRIRIAKARAAAKQKLLELTKLETG
jgi:hypothetical protein